MISGSVRFYSRRGKIHHHSTKKRISVTIRAEKVIFLYLKSCQLNVRSKKSLTGNSSTISIDFWWKILFQTLRIQGAEKMSANKRTVHFSHLTNKINEIYKKAHHI